MKIQACFLILFIVSVWCRGREENFGQADGDDYYYDDYYYYETPASFQNYIEYSERGLYFVIESDAVVIPENMEMTITFNFPATSTYDIGTPMATYWDYYWAEINATSISTDITDGVLTIDMAFEAPFEVFDYWFALEIYGGHFTSVEPGTYMVSVTISDGDLTYYNIEYPITIKSGINIDAGSNMEQTGNTDWLFTLVTRVTDTTEDLYITGFQDYEILSNLSINCESNCQVTTSGGRRGGTTTESSARINHEGNSLVIDRLFNSATDESITVQFSVRGLSMYSILDPWMITVYQRGGVAGYLSVNLLEDDYSYWYYYPYYYDYVEAADENMRSKAKSSSKSKLQTSQISCFDQKDIDVNRGAHASNDDAAELHCEVKLHQALQLNSHGSIVVNLPTQLHQHGTQEGVVSYTANGQLHTGKFRTTGESELTLSGFDFRKPVEITHLEFGVFDVSTKELKKASKHKKNAMLMVYDQDQKLVDKHSLKPNFQSSRLRQ